MEELAKTVGDASQSLKNLPEQMEKMITGVQDQIVQTRHLLGATSEEQTDQMKKMFSEMRATLQKANQDAIAAQSETADMVNEKMRKQVEQTASRLGESIYDAEKSINTLLQQQGEQTKAFYEQIINSQQTLTKGHELLKGMDASATSVHQMIEKTKEFSEQLMTGANRLEGAGQELKQASSDFNKENKEYLTANRETTRQIQDTVNQSAQVLDDFTQRFKTIDEGLNSIFAEIEQGLTTYATTSRESINKYLSEFSEQLSSAANALAGSVEALGDNVEILIDMIERRR